MANNEFEKIMAEAIMNCLMDAMAEQVAKKVAHDLIDITESTIDEAHLLERKSLIYLTIINELQKQVDKMSGEVKVE